MCSKDLIDPNYFWKKRVNHINEMSACLTNPVYCNIKRYFILLFLRYCLKTLFFNLRFCVESTKPTEQISKLSFCQIAFHLL